MKKFLFAALLLSSAALSQAGGIGIAAGAFYWHTDAKGNLNLNALDSSLNMNLNLSLDKDSMKGEGNAFYFFALEHPVPFLPYIRLSHTTLTHDGYGIYNFNGTPYALQGSLDLTHTDIAAYYSILDNILSLDIGLAARAFDGYIQGNIDNNGTPFTFSMPLDSVYALLYVGLEATLPLTGLALGTHFYGGDTGDERAIDLNAYIQYTSPIGLGITTGYRHLDIDIASNARAGTTKLKLLAELETSGPYFALHYRF